MSCRLQCLGDYWIFCQQNRPTSKKKKSYYLRRAKRNLLAELNQSETPSDNKWPWRARTSRKTDSFSSDESVIIMSVKSASRKNRPRELENSGLSPGVIDLSDCSSPLERKTDSFSSDESVIIMSVKSASRKNRPRELENSGLSPGVIDLSDCSSPLDKSLVITYTKSSDCDKLPHLRENCQFHEFTKKPLTRLRRRLSRNAEYCDTCYCSVCDVLASQCVEWKDHCDVYRQSKCSRSLNRGV